MNRLNKIAIQVVSLAVLALGTQSAHGAAVQPAVTMNTESSVSAAPDGSPPVFPTATNTPMARRDSLKDAIAYAASREGVPVVVIPVEEMDAAAVNRIVMDLSVMSRILERGVRELPALNEDVMMRELQGIYGDDYLRFGAVRTGPRILRSSNGQPRPMYIGGYGAVFSLQVDFPLVPPPEMTEQDQTAEPADQVWAQAQRELLDPQGATRLQRGAPQAEPYRQEVVEGLKNALIDALKHATNIRDLEAEAWLTILVQGPAPTAQGLPADSPNDEPLPPLAGPRSTARTLLTLRARKADIDLYAKGQLDDAQFQQRVQIVTY